MIVMASPKLAHETVRVEIPKQLHKAVLRIQVEEDLEFEEACLKVAERFDQNNPIFKEKVEREASRKARTEFISSLNTARETIRRTGYEQGYKAGLRDGRKEVRENEDNFRAPCSVCGKPMRFSNGDQDWAKEKGVLYQAFANWHHTTCAEN